MPTICALHVLAEITYGLHLTGPKRTGELSSEVATGCSLLKAEQDPPLKADHEYPEWLWRLLDPRPTASELQTTYEGKGLNMEQVTFNLLLFSRFPRLTMLPSLSFEATTVVSAEKQRCYQSGK